LTTRTRVNSDIVKSKRIKLLDLTTQDQAQLSLKSLKAMVIA